MWLPCHDCIFIVYSVMTSSTISNHSQSDQSYKGMISIEIIIIITTTIIMIMMITIIIIIIIIIIINNNNNNNNNNNDNK